MLEFLGYHISTLQFKLCRTKIKRCTEGLAIYKRIENL